MGRAADRASTVGMECGGRVAVGGRQKAVVVLRSSSSSPQELRIEAIASAFDIRVG